MPSTYEKIATTTLGSNQSTVTFSSIPATYTDLVIIMNGSDTGAVQLAIQYNNDANANYSMVGLTGNGSTAYSVKVANDSLIQFGWDAYLESGYNYNAIINIQNYSNTTTYKTLIGRANNATTGVTTTCATWRNTSAINEVKFLQAYGTDLFKTGSTFALYGILKA